MSKYNNYSTITFFRLTNLITTVTFFLVFFARNNAMEITVEPDGSLIDQLPPNFKTFESVREIFNIFPEMQAGDPIDQTICKIKIPSPQEKQQLTTKHGFSMSIPIPESPLTQLIENIPVLIVGQVDSALIQQHMIMLRKVLSAVANHQLLARALANPLFKFVIDYSKSMDDVLDPEAQAVTNPYAFLIVLHEIIFIDENILLGKLRNEFATLNVVIENDCRFGVHDREIFRGSAFTFYKSHQINAQLGIDNASKIKITKAGNAIEKQYYDFLKTQKDYSKMSLGKIKKIKRYKELEACLMSWIPQPTRFSDANEFLNRYFTAGNTQEEQYFNVYHPSMKNSKAAPLYIFPNSFRKKLNNPQSFYCYTANPRKVINKLQMLYELLIADRKRVMEDDTIYSNLPETQKFSEWLSFLEDALPPFFLQFLFPAYCDYMTEYTKLDQDNQSYCAV